MKIKAKLTEGTIKSRLFFMALPMVFGLFAMVSFIFIDTYFIAKLGGDELAALSFTFPVTMMLLNVAIGLGNATSSVVARAIGAGDPVRVRRLASDSLSLAFFISVCIAVLGMLTLDPVFRLLGAPEKILPLIKQYMVIWYLGSVFMIIPMVGNNVIRAAGDAKTPSMVMIIAALVNLVLDPILIFGLWGFPRLEMAGAAIATVIARAVTLVIALSILGFREKLLDWSVPDIRKVLQSWGEILYIAVPTTLTNLLTPLTMAIITRIIAGFGAMAVAAVGAATRAEALSLVVIMALASALTPVIGQNWGAAAYDRVAQAQRYSNRFSVWWGLFCMVLFFFAAEPVSHLFTKDPDVASNMVLYLWIVPMGYGLQGVFQLHCSSLNAINRPIRATLLNLFRMFVLILPFTLLGKRWFGLSGVFFGLGLANIVAGVFSFAAVRGIFQGPKSQPA